MQIDKAAEIVNHESANWCEEAYKKSQQYIKLRRLISLGIVRHKSVNAGTAIRKNKDDKKISNKYEVHKTKKIDKSKNKKI